MAIYSLGTLNNITEMKETHSAAVSAGAIDTVSDLILATVQSNFAVASSGLTTLIDLSSGTHITELLQSKKCMAALLGITKTMESFNRKAIP